MRNRRDIDHVCNAWSILNKIALLTAISRAAEKVVNAKIIRLPAPRRKTSEKESAVLAEIKALRAEMVLLRKLIAKAIPPSPFDYEDVSHD